MTECHKKGTETPRAKEIADCMRAAVDATDRERMWAYLDAARAAVEVLELELAEKSKALSDGVRLPEKPTAAMLRPFMGCPDDELELAYAAMLHIAKVEASK